MMKDYVEALEMCKKQAVQIVGLQNKQKELEAEKQEADEAYDDARQQIDFLQKKNESLEKRLSIATKALKDYANSDEWELVDSKNVYWSRKRFPYPWRIAGKALKEMEGVK